MNNELQVKGVVLLRGIVPKDSLIALNAMAERAAERFKPFSYSLPMGGLAETGDASREQLLAPINGLSGLIEEAMGELPVCNLDHSWVRKRFAPPNAPRLYQPNVWHQDGGLGVAFGPDPASPLPMTRLLTCWIPLCACGGDRPALEFVRHRLDSLFHYTELDDQKLRQRFAPEEFWAPELDLGDALLLLPGTLHRTYVRMEMKQDRLSLEYRFFPAGNSKINERD